MIIEPSFFSLLALNVAGYKYEIAPVSDKDGVEVTFHFHKRYRTGGSFMKEYDYKNFNKTNIISYKTFTKTIDRIVKERNVGPFQFMKMDIQGAELMALRGAKETLKSVIVAIIEVSFQQYNPGSASPLDIEVFMRSQGFRLVNIADLMMGGAGRFLLQADMVYMKKNHEIFSYYPAPPPDQSICSIS